MTIARYVHRDDDPAGRRWHRDNPTDTLNRKNLKLFIIKNTHNEPVLILIA